LGKELRGSTLPTPDNSNTVPVAVMSPALYLRRHCGTGANPVGFIGQGGILRLRALKGV